MSSRPKKGGKRRQKFPGSNKNFFCLLLYALILTSLLFITGCDIPRYYDAATLLIDIESGTEGDFLDGTAHIVSRKTVTFMVNGLPYKGDIYLPEGTVRAGVVVVPGAAEEGRDDSRLIAFASALSRIELAVLVPDLPSLRELEVHSGNIQEIESAVLYLTRHEDLSPHDRVGLVAFSYAAGPAVLAALKPEVRSKIDVILTIGGYYSLPDVLTFITTGDYQVEDTWQHMEPNPYGQWVFVKSNLRYLDDADDRALFRQMINRKKANREAPVADLAQQLGSQGRALYRFITNRERSRVDALYAELPMAIRSEVRRLDLSEEGLGALEARLILVHGYDDTIIPFSQSVMLEKALPSRQAELYLVDGLMHVDASPGLVGRWRMWRALASFLLLRNADEIR